MQNLPHIESWQLNPQALSLSVLIIVLLGYKQKALFIANSGTSRVIFTWSVSLHNCCCVGAVMMMLCQRRSWVLFTFTCRPSRLRRLTPNPGHQQRVCSFLPVSTKICPPRYLKHSEGRFNKNFTILDVSGRYEPFQYCIALLMFLWLTPDNLILH